MSSELTTVATDVQDFLEAYCPEGWKVTQAEKLNGKTNAVVLTFEQLDISQNAPDESVTQSGYVWVTFQLVLSTPETDAVKGLPRLTEAAGQLIRVLNGSPDLRWGPEATRSRLETGESVYLIPLAVLATNFPPTPEPDVEPDPQPEEA